MKVRPIHLLIASTVFVLLCVGAFASAAAAAAAPSAGIVADTGTSSSRVLARAVLKIRPRIFLESSVKAPVYGQPVKFTVTVAAGPTVLNQCPPGIRLELGGVQLYDGSTKLGKGTGALRCVSPNTYRGSVIIANLAVGTHSITAVYSGSSRLARSASAPLKRVVGKADTTTMLVSSANPSVYGQAVTFTATVSAVAPGRGTPTGKVQLHDYAGVVVGDLNGDGKATFTISSLAVGTHTITAQYDGDTNFTAPAAGPSVLNQTDNKAATTTMLVSSANPSVSGQPVTFTATVTPVAPGAGTSTGVVVFEDHSQDGARVVEANLNGAGKATFTMDVLRHAGSHTITAQYNGDANFTSNTSSVLTQTDNKATTTTMAVASVDSSPLGQSVTFTATVSSVAPGVGTPTGSVQFMSGSTNLGSASLIEGVVQYSTRFRRTNDLLDGAQTFTATYSGDTNFLASSVMFGST